MSYHLQILLISFFRKKLKIFDQRKYDRTLINLKREYHFQLTFKFLKIIIIIIMLKLILN